MARRRNNQSEPAVPLPVIGVVGVLLGGGAGWIATMPESEQRSRLTAATETVAEAATETVAEVAAAVQPEPRPYRHFSGCNDARAAGYENIRRDEPSYRPDMDGDGDGLACEPYR